MHKPSKSLASAPWQRAQLLPRVINVHAPARMRSEALIFQKPRSPQPPSSLPVKVWDADLAVSYGRANGDSFEVLDQINADALELSGDELHSVAVANLRGRLRGRIKFHRLDTFFMLQADADMEADTLLLDELWCQLATVVQGELRVVVPGRTMVAFTGTAHRGQIDGKPASAARCIQIMSIAARHCLAEEGKHSLSEFLLGRIGNSWQTIAELRYAGDSQVD